MNQKEFYKLGMGDIIKYKGQGRSYLVIQNDGEKIKAVSVIEDTHSGNWEIIAKASYPIEFIKDEKLAES
jgi:hypothetical protein